MAKERVKRSSNDPVLITEKALLMKLGDKIELVKVLRAQIEQEVKDAAAKAAEMTKLASGL